jgi:hypothetical protein
MTRNLVLPPGPYAKSLHISPRYKVAYVNNPKVACSTIKLTLQRAELGDPAYAPVTSVHDHAASPLLTTPEINAQIAEARALEGCFVFSFVRNPFARLRSVYLNKIVERQKKGKFREAAGFDRDTCPGFADFVAAVCAQPPARQNPHWRLQALNLSVQRHRFDMLGRLETFATDWKRLAAATGLPETTSFAGKKTERAAHADLQFDAGMIAAVAEAYAADFEHFGYDPGSAP